MKKRIQVIIILTFLFLSVISLTTFLDGKKISQIESIAPSYTSPVNKSFLSPKECSKNIIWDNFSPSSGSSALSSQLDIIYPFNSQVADDIMVTNNTQVTGVHWWGVFFGGDPPWPNPCDFNIIFYADDGSGNRPTGAGMDDPTSTALAVYFFPNVTGIPSEPYDSYWYQINLTHPFNFTSNTKYWIAIQAVLNIPPQWGWWSNGDNPDQLHLPVQGFPELGVQYWTDLDPWYGGDMAFYLTGHLSTPPSPPIIHGTINGDVNIEYNFWTDPIIDPYGDSLYIRWDWDDGNITDWLGPYSSGSIASASHAWEDPGVYDIRAQLKGTGGESTWSEPHTITIVQNQPPSTPILTGPSQGKRGISYNYKIESLDPENENISYYIDWADGTNTGWIGPFLSGQEQTLSHTWNKKGTYMIKAKARDNHDQESDWGTLTVIMPYEPPHFRFFDWLFEQFPHAFPLIRFIFNY
jgi:hypothetical protein